MISKYEIDYLLKKDFDPEKIIYLSPKYELTNCKYDSHKTKDIVFIGSSHEPNIVGMNIFIEYFNYIIKDIPDLKLHIIGSCCNNIKTDNKNIVKHYFVDDIEKIIYNFRICIVPLTIGAGIKIKVLDSLNYGIPIIATQKAIEGINILNNIHYFNLELDMDIQTYVREFIKIYQNPNNLNNVSNNSKAFFNENYCNNQINVDI